MKVPYTTRRGSLLVLLCVLLIAFLVTVAFSVDVAYMQLVRTELRCAADAAARAGAEALAREQEAAAATTAATEIAAANRVGGRPLQLANQDIILGQSVIQQNGRWDFQAGLQPYNAVQVIASREAQSASGPVGLFFGPLFGRSTFGPRMEAVATQLDREICIVMDRSGSMAWDLTNIDWSYPPYSPRWKDPYYLPPHSTLSRWAAATAAVALFLDELEETNAIERVSLVTYSHSFRGGGYRFQTATREQSLTDNYGLINAAMQRISRNPICGGTNIGRGIDYGRSALTSNASRPLAAKTMIVLTDGVWNQGTNPIYRASVAAAENITIHAITFSDGADIPTMQEVARRGGGIHIHAPDENALRDAFLTIARTLPVAITD